MLRRVGRISKETMTIIIRTIETIIAFIIVAGGLAFWRLYTEPVEMKDMLPELAARIIPAESGLSIQAESVVLSAEVRDEGLIHISIRDLTMTRGDGIVAVRLPNVEMSYGIWHILTLDYTPDNLSIKDPFLQLIVGENGRIYIRDDGTASVDDSAAMIDEKTVSPEKQLAAVDAFLRYILSFNSMSLKDARIVIDDRQKGEKLSIPSLDLDLERQFGFNHALKGAAVVLVDKDLMNITAEAQLNRLTRRMSFEVGFSDVVLKKLGRVIPVLAEADLTVQGHINGLFDFSQNSRDALDCLEEGAFQIKVEKPGRLILPAPLTNTYPVQSATINGAVGRNAAQIKIARSEAALTGGPTAGIEVDIKGLNDFWKTGNLDRIKTVLKASISALPIEQVPAVWPSALGPDAHAWVKANLTEGRVLHADFTLYFTGGELVDLFGKVPVEGVRVRYLDEMTPVESVGGTVLLYPDKVTIAADKGHIGDLQLINADINLTELQDDISNAHIVLKARGPVQDGMRLIAMKPLEFPQAFGLNPDRTGGYATVSVDVRFPLIEALTQKQVKADVSADIVDGVFATPVSGMTLKNGKLALHVTNNELVLTGTGQIGAVPMTLKWTEFFEAVTETAVQSRYDIEGAATAAQIASFWPQAEQYISGTAAGTAMIEKSVNGQMKGHIRADLNQAGIKIYPISVFKPAGVPAMIDIMADIGKDASAGSATVHLTGTADKEGTSPLRIRGKGSWGNGYKIVLEEVTGPGTAVSGEINLDNGQQFSLKLKGSSLNLSGLHEMSDTVAEETEQGSIPNVQQTPPAVTFDVDLDSLILSAGKPLRQVRIKGARQGYFWRDLAINAEGATSFSLIFNPETRSVVAGTRDLGDFLERLGVSQRFTGGALSLKASQPATGGFVGSVDVSDFSLKDPGFLIQAVTILGIVDAIRGKELSFKKAEIPFELTPHLTLYLKDGYAYGTTLGLTFKGRIRPDALDLVGSVIPAYAINSLPGKIPLIGRLFTDGTGGGLMGVKYELKGAPANPSVHFNALGSIAPGIFGNLFH